MAAKKIEHMEPELIISGNPIDYELTELLGEKPDDSRDQSWDVAFDAARNLFPLGGERNIYRDALVEVSEWMRRTREQMAEGLPMQPETMEARIAEILQANAEL